MFLSGAGAADDELFFSSGSSSLSEDAISSTIFATDSSSGRRRRGKKRVGSSVTTSSQPSRPGPNSESSFSTFAISRLLSLRAWRHSWLQKKKSSRGIHTVQSCRGECRGASECRGALHLRHLCGTSSAVLSRVPVASRIGCLHAPQFTMATHPTGSSAGGRTTW